MPQVRHRGAVGGGGRQEVWSESIAWQEGAAIMANNAA
jgi:hypothetical protein